MRPALALLAAAPALCAGAGSSDPPSGWLLSAGSGPLTAAAVAAHFDAFASRFGKTYATPAEEARRRAIFQANLEWVAANAPETHGVTRFSDLTPEEFRAAYLHNDEPGEAEEARARAERPRWSGDSCEACGRYPEMADFRAETLDWSTKGAVTAVKDQGQCDSCYAFGATGDMEGSWFLAGNALVSLSEQELVSCVGKYNGTKKGCGGGSRSKQFRWVIANGGVTTEANYPYTSGRTLSTGTCDKSKTSPVAAQIDSFLQVSDSADGEPQIMNALNKLGPISIGISAIRMELYVGGILSPTFCAQKHDHAPLIVGYGADGSNTYWKIKNSWGRGWGEKGYFRAQRDKNVCGLATDAVHTKVGGGKRYHCHLDTLTCEEAPKGHASRAACEAVCNDNPTPPPTPRPVVPTPPPTPPITRYHCDKDTFQCIEVPPGGTPGGHPSVDKCEAACFAPGYLCNADTKQCYGVTTGGDKLHTCRDQCGSAPTPIPVWTPPPTPPPAPPTPVPKGVCPFDGGCLKCFSWCGGGANCATSPFTCKCNDGRSCHD